ncbi:hypothetical protein GTNG_1553 [Geobacillus thermodenitrificans NG80-2]|uniref:Uncharacterized protein n=1 Tax=Geobacillus thermodenitrificans (strain NG80-2) TaxID=420246 RepID=A4INL7_GEOTN|nr:hypothetical protein GTNG_1553 [Geobacillus thermodenitrificans NG80-2]
MSLNKLPRIEPSVSITMRYTCVPTPGLSTHVKFGNSVVLAASANTGSRDSTSSSAMGVNAPPFVERSKRYVIPVKATPDRSANTDNSSSTIESSLTRSLLRVVIGSKRSTSVTAVPATGIVMGSSVEDCVKNSCGNNPPLHTQTIHFSSFPNALDLVLLY